MSADERIRALERQALHDPAARDRLHREKARHGQPVWIADILQQAGLGKVALSSVASGVRAVLKETKLRDVSATIWSDATSRYVYTKQGSHSFEKYSAVQEKFRKVFGISLGPFYHTHREEKREPYEPLHYAGPTLATEHQDIFLEAVRVRENQTPSLAPTGRDYRRDDVVLLRKPGARRRYVVVNTRHDPRLPGVACFRVAYLDLVALSGAVRGSVIRGIAPDRVSLDADQTVEFTGAIADQLLRYYEARFGG